MELQKNRIALVSPSHNSYSETFIQSQKKGLKGDIFYYYGGSVPVYLEGFGKLLTTRVKLFNKLFVKFGLTKLGAQEMAFHNSLKQNKIQVVLAQYGTTAHRIVSVCASLKIPLVTHFHGFDASIKEVVEGCSFYKEVFTYSTFVIVVSREMEKMLVEIGCPQDKIVYNPCAPQTEFSKIKPAYTKKQFVAIGRFTDKKAPYYTILAFKEVLEKHPKANLVIAGDGILYNTCQNLIKLYKLEKNISLLGIISPEDFRMLLKESLAFVQHSITSINGDMEGTPVAVLEASAAGLPVISTNHAGIPDVILDGETGLLSNEHDVKTMSSNMIKLLDNVDLAKTLGSNGKTRINKYFNMKQHLNKLQTVLDRVIVK